MSYNCYLSSSGSRVEIVGFNPRRFSLRDSNLGPPHPKPLGITTRPPPSVEIFTGLINLINLIPPETLNSFFTPFKYYFLILFYLLFIKPNITNSLISKPKNHLTKPKKNHPNIIQTNPKKNHPRPKSRSTPRDPKIIQDPKITQDPKII